MSVQSDLEDCAENDMAWQHPTRWSWETKNGKHYIEKASNVKKYAAYYNGNLVGVESTLRAAKALLENPFATSMSHKDNIASWKYLFRLVSFPPIKKERGGKPKITSI